MAKILFIYLLLFIIRLARRIVSRGPAVAQALDGEDGALHVRQPIQESEESGLVNDGGGELRGPRYGGFLPGEDLHGAEPVLPITGEPASELDPVAAGVVHRRQVGDCGIAFSHHETPSL